MVGQKNEKGKDTLLSMRTPRLLLLGMLLVLRLLRHPHLNNLCPLVVHPGAHHSKSTLQMRLIFCSLSTAYHAIAMLRAIPRRRVFSIPLISNLAFFSTSSIPNSNNLGILIDNNISLPFFHFLSNHVAHSFLYM